MTTHKVITEQPGLGVNWPLDRTGRIAPFVTPGGRTVYVAGVLTAVAASRDLTVADDGGTLDCTASGLTLTVPTGLPLDFSVVVLANGTTSVASSGGVLLNGATDTLVPFTGSFAIIGRSVADSYVVTGV
jgi:hypothetical protein